MKFIKANLTLVICGAVVVLALVAWLVWPLPSMRADLLTKMTARYQDKTTIDHIGSTQLQLPGQEKPVVGPPNGKWVDAKKHVIDAIQSQKTQVETLSHDINSHGRVNGSVPILPLAVGSGAKWTLGKEEPGCLPRVSGNAAAISFKQDYGAQFAGWTTILAKGTVTPGQTFDAAMKAAGSLSETDLKALYNDDLKKRPFLTGASGGQGGAAADPADEQRFDRNTLLNRAKDVQMYVDRTAFQVRPWLSSDEPPTEEQIFTAMVDSWLQADVVRAIREVNNPGGKASKDVSQSPVKRLLHITVGNAARTHVVSAGAAAQSNGGGGGGSQIANDPSLFFTSAEAAQAPGSPSGPMLGTAVGGGGGSAPAAPAAPNAIDYNVSMTGHASGGQYDVVLMSIWMDIDPAKLVDFMDQLYQQNVGYTVTNVQLKTVDPLDRAANGYIYGNGQAVEAEIQVEAILFRGWTTPLMPAGVREGLGVPAAK